MSKNFTWIRFEGWQCIAIPQRERNRARKKISPRQRRGSQIMGRIEDWRGQALGRGVKPFWDLCGSIYSNTHEKSGFQNSGALPWNISQILFTAGMLKGLKSNIHTMKQPLSSLTYSAQSGIKPFQLLSIPWSVDIFHPVKSTDTGA